MDLMDMATDPVETPDSEAMPPVPPAEFLAVVADPRLQNFADMLPEQKRMEIARLVLEEYEIDLASMSAWLEAMEKGLDLASLVKTDKNYPFERASNVKFPLVTSAALQFNARAYPAVVPNGDIVLCRTFGKDPQGMKRARADRVAAHMSYQLAAKTPEWEAETDRLLVCLPLVGTMLRKWWYDPAQERIRVKLCDAGKVIINDAVRSIEAAPRISECVSLYPYEVQERVKSKLFLPVDQEPMGEDRDAPIEFIEQHRRIDLDEDGYPEPYIVTVEKERMQLVRIVADFTAEDVNVAEDGSVLSIRRNSHYADYHFLPQPKGGFWSMGFGLLLGDTSESINTIINQLLDAGHMSSLGAGFIGAEFKIKGGAQRFRPGEWKTVMAGGSDIRQAMVPLQFPEPSPVLFQMLGLLIEAGREIASVKDVMTGEANRQMTATTTLALIEQGQMLFTAAYKRVWRALKQEFQIIARLNQMTVDPLEYMAFHDTQEPLDPARDYDLRDMDISPVADPRAVTNPQKLAKAQFLMELAQAGLVDPVVASTRMMEAAGIDNIEELMPKPDPLAAETAKIGNELAIMKMLAEVEKLQADTIKSIAQAEAAEAGPQLQVYMGQLDLLKERMRAAIGGQSAGMAGEPGNTAPPADIGMDGLAAALASAGGGMGVGGTSAPIPG